MAASIRRTDQEVEVDPAGFFESVFTERTGRLREQAEQLRKELECIQGTDEPDHHAEHDQR